MVSIAGTTQQPPYTAYIAVVSSSYSACNYSVLVTAYDSASKQTTPIPLQQRAAAEQRYRSGRVPLLHVQRRADTNLTTVALTETYGQAWLLLNSPNTTALPTIDSAQYSSEQPTFPLVALTQPAAGTWTIGVWSNQSSAFSIVAADGVTHEPMQLGVMYPGVYSSGEYAYYSVYIDALQLSATPTAYLDLELYRGLGDTELYCSNTTVEPTRLPTSVVSSDSGPATASSSHQPAAAGHDVLRRERLCRTSTFTFSASYGSAITLTAGETVTAQSCGRQLAAVLVRVSASEPVVTLSVVSDVGTTALYIGAYGWRQGQPNDHNGSGHAAAAADSSPPLCGVNNSLAHTGLQPAAVSDAGAGRHASVGVYRITAETDWAVGARARPADRGRVSTSQSAYLSFSMPDNLSNVTLVVTVTNGASGLIAVGWRGYTAITFVWTVVQPADSSVLSSSSTGPTPAVLRMHRRAPTWQC